MEADDNCGHSIVWEIAFKQTVGVYTGRIVPGFLTIFFSSLYSSFSCDIYFSSYLFSPLIIITLFSSCYCFPPVSQGKSKKCCMCDINKKSTVSLIRYVNLANELSEVSVFFMCKVKLPYMISIFLVKQ